MQHRSPFIIMLVFGVMFVKLGAASELTDGYWRLNKHKNFLYYGFSDLYQHQTRIKCAKICLKTPYCTAFSIVKEYKLCYIFKHRDYDAFVNGDPFQGLLHYRKRVVDCPLVAGYALSADEEVCLKIFTAQLNLDDASYTCKTHGGHLFLMDSDYKKDALKKHFQSGSAKQGDYFLGGSQKVVKGKTEFRWLNDRQVDPTMWNPLEKFGSRDTCVVTRPVDFFLGVTSCETPAMFVCEVS